MVEASYLGSHAVLTLIGYLRFETALGERGSYDPAAWLLAAWLLLSLCSLGRLADGDGLGVRLEWARLLLLLPAALATGAAASAAAVALLGLWAAVGRSWWTVRGAEGKAMQPAAADGKAMKAS
jgi:hypothetical protein